MEEWNKIYKINKELDVIFNERYSNDLEYYNKNCIELIVEIAELANATKCFKYWSMKKQNKEEVLEEYADCVMMILSFHTYFNLELEENKIKIDTTNIFEMFNKLFEEASQMMYNGSETLIKEIFNNMLYLGKMLSLKEKEIYDTCYKKMNVVKERLNSDY